ncbi:MAG: aminotransferase class V-fold PLP-dependent enzyme [Firmicutes bacterium]|nr:aminotransferase class V-fold PLP-dependent enzyme [Bacillota bacterium]
MIYLDNAATSYPKPRGMVAAMEECILKYCGNPGRSGHSMSMRTGEEVYHARRKIARLFNIEQAERLVFTKNTTEALNMGLKGVLLPGDHVITTSMEHNSVLRPLKALEKRGIRQSIIRADREGFVKPSDFEKAIRPETRLIAVTAASNVTGTKMPLEEIGELARKRGILFLVDGAQGAGSMEIDVKKMNISMLAFPGHKGLLGPQGTGALYIDPELKLNHIMEGGTGTDSKSRLQPCEFPDGYEAGTINAPAIIGLGYSAEFVEKIGPEVIGKYEEELIGWLDERLDEMDFVTRYGPQACRKTGISLINIRGAAAEEVTSILSSRYGIAVRGGFHCAGLAHKTIGTWDEGAVRISVGPFNTRRDMEKLTDAIREIGRRHKD